MDTGQIKIRLKNDLILRLKSEAFLSGKSLSRHISDRLEFLGTEAKSGGEKGLSEIESKLRAIEKMISSGNGFSKLSGGIDPKIVKFLAENILYIRFFLVNFGGRSLSSQDAAESQKSAETRSKALVDPFLNDVFGW